MKLFSKREEEIQQVKKATVEVDAEYYSHLLCKEYLLEAVAEVVASGDTYSKIDKIAAILQINLSTEN